MGHKTLLIMPPNWLGEKPGSKTLSGLIASARDIMGIDTRVIHLATAVDRPTVSFWGSCFKRTCNHFICMGKITPEMLLTRFKKEPN